MSDGNGGGPSFGQRTATLLRTLTINGLLVLVPVVIYYFAVIVREDRFRTEQAFDGLREIRAGLDTYFERVEALLRNVIVVAPGDDAAFLAARARDLGLVLDSSAGGPSCTTPSDGAPPSPLQVWIDPDAAPGQGLRFRLCQSLPKTQLRDDVAHKPVQLRGPASSLLVHARAVQRYAQVLLVASDGNVLATLDRPEPPPPGARAAAQEPVSTMLPATAVTGLLAARPSSGPAQAIGGDAKAAPVLSDSPRVVDLPIAGQDYRAYIAPIRMPQPLFQSDPCAAQKTGDCQAGAREQRLYYLVGLVPKSRLDEAGSALGLAGTWYLLVAVLACVSAGPLLRVLLLAPNAALRPRLLVISTIGCVILAGVVTLVIEALIVQRHLLDRRDQEARLYAARMAEAADNELRRGLQALRPYADWFAAAGTAAPAPADVQLTACDGYATAAASRPCRRESDEAGYCRIDVAQPAADAPAPDLRFSQIIAPDAEGLIRRAPILTPFGCQRRAAAIPVQARPYFTRLRDGLGWPVPPGLWTDGSTAPQRFIAQRLFAKVDASIGLEIAVPKSDPNDPRRFGGLVGVLTAAYPLSAAIKAPFLDFAIVDDATGAVVFHADDAASIAEDFVAQTGQHPQLLRALADRRPAEFTGYYRGEAQHFASHPVASAPWTVVVFHASERTEFPAFGGAIIAVAQLAQMLLAASLAIGLLLVLQRLALRVLPGWMAYRWQWVWPQWRLRDRYPAVIALLVLLIAGHALVLWNLPELEFDQRWAPATLLLCVLSWIGMQWWFRPTALPGERERWKRRRHLKPAAVIATGAAPATSTENNTAPRRFEACRRWLRALRSQTQSLRAMRFLYVSTLVLMLIMVGSLPATMLYLGAMRTLRTGAERVALEEVAASFEQRRARIEADVRRQAAPPLQGYMQRRPSAELALDEVAVGYLGPLERGSNFPLYVWAPACTAGKCAMTGLAETPLAPRETPPWRRFVIDLLAPYWPELLPVSRQLAQRPADSRTDIADGERGAATDSARRSGWARVVPAHAGSERIGFPLDLRLPLQSSNPPSVVFVRVEASEHLMFDPDQARWAPPPRSTRVWDSRARPLLFGGLTLAGLGLIVGIAVMLSRRVLGVDAPPAPRSPLLPGSSREALKALAEQMPPAMLPHGPDQPPWRWWYVGPRNAAMVVDLAWLQAQVSVLRESSIIDLTELDFGALPELQPELLMFTHFDRAILDPQRRKPLLALLERRAALPVTTLLVSMSPPWALLDDPARFPASARLPDADEALRWTALRRCYTAHHWHEFEPTLALPAWLQPAQLADLGHGRADRMLYAQLRDELIALVELLGRVPRSLASAQGLAEHRRLRSIDDLRAVLIDEVQSDLQRIWSFCSVAERLALYQLATDRIPNPRNRLVLDDLMMRRLVLLVPQPRIACEMLRRFVLEAETPAQFAEWSGLEHDGAWEAVRTPFVILLGLLLAWFAFSASDWFNTTLAVLGGTAALLANVGKVMGFARNGGSGG